MRTVSDKRRRWSTGSLDRRRGQAAERSLELGGLSGLAAACKPCLFLANASWLSRSS